MHALLAGAARSMSLARCIGEIDFADCANEIKCFGFAGRLAGSEPLFRLDPLELLASNCKTIRELSMRTPRNSNNGRLRRALCCEPLESRHLPAASIWSLLSASG